MFTTGSKLFFGAAVLAIVAFVVYGVDSQWEMFGCTVLVGLAVATVFLGGVTIAFRDTNLEGEALAALSAADAEGRHLVPGTGVPPSLWPLVTAFGIAVLALGLVLDERFFLLGVVAAAAGLIEWMVQAWADRASGDQAYNAKLRARTMHPIEFPVLGVLAGGLVVFGFSRLMLALPKNGSIWAFIGLGVVILAVATVLAFLPRLSRNLLSVVLVIGGVGILTAGIISIGFGERSFAEHEQTAEKDTNQVGDKSSVAATVISSGGTFTPASFSIPRSLTVNVIFQNDNPEGEQALVIVGPEITTKAEDGTEKVQAQEFRTGFVGKDKRAVVTFKITRPGQYEFHTEGAGPAASGTILVP
jgi:hypothetical protein